MSSTERRRRAVGKNKNVVSNQQPDGKTGRDLMFNQYSKICIWCPELATMFLKLFSDFQSNLHVHCECTSHDGCRDHPYQRRRIVLFLSNQSKHWTLSEYLFSLKDESVKFNERIYLPWCLLNSLRMTPAAHLSSAKCIHQSPCVFAFEGCRYRRRWYGPGSFHCYWKFRFSSVLKMSCSFSFNLPLLLTPKRRKTASTYIVTFSFILHVTLCLSQASDCHIKVQF